MTINKLSEGALDTHTVTPRYRRAVAHFGGYCPTEVLIYISSDSTSDGQLSDQARCEK